MLEESCYYFLKQTEPWHSVYMQKLGRERVTRVVGTFRKGQKALADPAKEL